MKSVALERHGEALVAAKRSDSPRRLGDEAILLKRFHHPGVVEFISFDDDEPLLVTAWAGTDTWERRSSTGISGALHLLAAVASTIADLHLAGISHRSLSPGHVIIANDGRPVLCGFGDAGQADETGLEADRSGLIGLVKFAADSIGGRDAERLESLNDWLENPHSDAAGFARAVEAIASKEIEPRSTLSVRAAGSIAGLMALALLGVGFLVTRHHDPVSAEPPAPVTPTSTSVPATPTAPPTTAPPTTMDHPIESPPTTMGHPIESPPTTPRPEAVPLILQHGGRRYGLGDSGDLAVVGDWNCDGQDTPAILQVSTGIVAVFGSWPDPGSQIEPQFTVPASGVESLQADKSGACDILRARSPYGSRIITQESS